MSEIYIDNDILLECKDLEKRYELLQKELLLNDQEWIDYENHYSAAKERENHYLHEIDLCKSQETSRILLLEDKLKILNLQVKEDVFSECLYLDNKITAHQDELRTIESIHKVETFEEIQAISLDNSLITLRNTLQDDLHDKRLKRDALRLQNSDIKIKYKNLQTELGQLKDNYTYTNEQILEAKSSLDNLEEELFLAKNDLARIKQSVIQRMEDNSLFAEVNDRRVELQKNIEKMKSKCCDIKNEITFKQKELSNVKFLNEELLNFKKHYENEFQKDMLGLSDAYLNRISTLEYICEDYSKDIQQKQDLINDGLPYDTLEFLSRLDEEKRKINARIENEKGTQFRAQKMLSLKLKEVQLKIEEDKRIIDSQLQPKLIELENTMEVLKNQSKPNGKTTKDNEPLNAKTIPAKSINLETPQYNQEDENHKTQPAVKPKPQIRKVTFTQDTAYPKSNTLKGGGKIIQLKSVHISNLLKK